MDTIITRGNNVFGAGQFPEKLIPKFICLLEQGKKLCIHGNGNNARRYVYIDDAAEAYDIVLHHGIAGQVYNISVTEDVSNLDVARSLLRIYRIPEQHWQDYIQFVEDRLYNDRRYATNTTKLRKLGWTPKVNFYEGLKLTVEWYRQHYASWWDSDITHVLVPHPTLPTFRQGN